MKTKQKRPNSMFLRYVEDWSRDQYGDVKKMNDARLLVFAQDKDEAILTGMTCGDSNGMELLDALQLYNEAQACITRRIDSILRQCKDIFNDDNDL